MAIKVGRVPYLSSEPFYFDMVNRGIQLQDFLPGALGEAAAKGEVDACPVSLVDSFKLEERFIPVAGFCVAARDKATSELLYSTRPIDQLSGASIGVSAETATALPLLKVLLKFKYNVQPDAYVTLQDSSDAFLISGDPGLRRRRGARGFPHRYDLGEEWFDWTGLPFVFSRWVMRKDLDPKDQALIEDTLYVGLEDGVDSLFHISDPRENLLMLRRDLVEYIQVLKFDIGVAEQ